MASKRITQIGTVFILLILMLTACGNTWQKHYELGVKYLADGNYEEAVIEITAAIELDDKKLDAYISLAEAYRLQNMLREAANIARQGYEITKEPELQELWQKYEKACIRQSYKEFFFENFAYTDKVVLADLTHDGKEEMLVIEVSGETDYPIYEMKVFRYADKKGVEKLCDLYGGTNDHAGGLFNAYIKVKADGYANLGRKRNGMWQGRGTLAFDEYYLDEKGKIVPVDSVELNSIDEGNHYPDGEVTEKAYSDYSKKESDFVKKFKCIIYNDGTGISDKIPKVESRPEKVFAS